MSSRYNWALDYFGGHTDNELKSYSRILFLNGELDPWSTGGVTTTLNEENDLISIYMPDCAHHLDLRSPNPLDPESVV